MNVRVSCRPVSLTKLREAGTCWDLASFGDSECVPGVCLPVPRWERICNSTLSSFPEPCDLAGLLGWKGKPPAPGSASQAQPSCS